MPVQALVEPWIRPIRIAPSTAPGRFPIPPSTADGERDQAELEALVEPDAREVEGDRRDPAAPASAPAIMNVNEIVRLTLMPIIALASMSCAVARIALPCRVRCTR